jgi:hypothetical protein
MLKILGQMEAPALILDHLYLGTEWNASHQQDLFDKEYIAIYFFKFANKIIQVNYVIRFFKLFQYQLYTQRDDGDR